MRADQQLSVEIGGDFFQIACEDTETIIELKTKLAPWLGDGQGLPGFKISVPEQGNKMWVLLGSNGNILARAPERSAVINTLLRHLASMNSPQPPSTQRLGISAIAGPSGTVLVDEALLNAQPPIERLLGRAGLSVVDSPYIQVELEEPPTLSPIEASEPASEVTAEGHLHPALAEGAINGLLWAASPGAAEVTPGQVAHALASVARSGSHAARLDFGVGWSEKLHVELVDPQEKGAVLRSAKELLKLVD